MQRPSAREGGGADYRILAYGAGEQPRIFAGSAIATSALLDRLLHHSETVVLEAGSYRGPQAK